MENTPHYELPPTHFAPLEFSPDEYLHYIEEYDLTYDQQVELLRIIADIIRQFIDLGFNIHPIQCANKHEQLSVDVVEMLQQYCALEKDSELN